MFCLGIAVMAFVLLVVSGLTPNKVLALWIGSPLTVVLILLFVFSVSMWLAFRDSKVLRRFEVVARWLRTRLRRRQ